MKKVAIIGAGAAGLMAAQVLAQAGLQVDIYEKMSSPARKFLLAGRGGLNLTHSEDFEKFLTRYNEAGVFLRPALENFTPQHTRAWAADLGVETFVGSSRRVFPMSFKASPLLRAWLRRLNVLNVRFHFNYTWQGEMLGDFMLLAMGGGSWARLGSDGGFVEILRAKNIEVNDLKPSNMGFLCDWSSFFKEKFAGHPLKSCVFRFGNQTLKGEAMITAQGLEGGAIYALSAALREAILTQGEAILTLDLKPDISLEALKVRYEKATGSHANKLRKIGLSPLHIALLHEVGGLNLNTIKALPLKFNGFQAIEKAISTAGGVALQAVNLDLSLKRYPALFVAGEMLDFEAPTGGYLLQAAFSTGVYAAKGIISKQ